MDVLLTLLTLLAAIAIVLVVRARRRALDGFVTCPYSRARLLHRLERSLSERKGITLAEHSRSGPADNRARTQIAIAKDARLLALYMQRCVRDGGEVLLDAGERRRFNDEARRLDLFYPERPSSL